MYCKSSQLLKNIDGDNVLLEKFINEHEQITLITVYSGSTLNKGQLIAYDFVGEVD